MTNGNFFFRLFRCFFLFHKFEHEQDVYEDVAKVRCSRCGERYIVHHRLRGALRLTPKFEKEADAFYSKLRAGR